ncbi:hypothetical protein [Thermus scotoductus]|uniref:Uncharacterized protein n=1 Tax=Thermus scotoductus TaxID=37636 RepID=A0A430S1C5_THESC|nr:hypothetical protein [Thermus scotoductus]RTG97845.1 hypothetical protein CSW51_02765 [Thermus scotoductus]RTH27352.1 hypothetical protein CSW38_03675 [Thermus scotoductus]RTI17107.1 hypothetical protein CSW27_02360 [Thermus scotoductus]
MADLLFHRWNTEAVEEKAKAPKGSKAKRQDDLETYVWRDENGYLALPGEYLRQSIIRAAKYRQDPRSPRKSAQDLVKAALLVEPMLASLGVKDWDYEHRARVRVQQSAITRVRPAIKRGWRAEFFITVLLPEYIDPHLLHQLLTDAGRLEGVGDFRPTYGRFAVVLFEPREP